LAEREKGETEYLCLFKS